ncbi:HigA family addiction module antidote protein [Stappia sp. 22II-S9-Z10]|nr:HigA family addiction module antidote protein [Stappia sp. 22II-S9-Z10]
MHDPIHPGAIVREECLAAVGLNVTEGAKVLGVTRQALNNLVNEKAGISPEMAIRLEKAFGSSAEFWLGLQAAYELAQARKGEADIDVVRYAPVSLDGKLSQLPESRRAAIEATADRLHAELPISAGRQVPLAQTPHTDKNA